MLTLVRTCLLILSMVLPHTVQASPSVALYYGAAAPLDDLKVFDIVVVDADHGYDPKAYAHTGSQLYGYAAVTEVHPTRPYFQRIPDAWHLGRNADWDSVLIDQSQPEWPIFFADQVIAPMWERGYRGFFLDTLDSYRLASEFDEQHQQQGLIAVITTLHQRFPGIQLILNRGFDILPQLKGQVQMVAAESLFQGWNAASKQYGAVKEEDRNWLLGQLRKARDELGIPVLVIDYVAPQDRAKTRATAQKIQALGFTPWVTDAQLQTIGIGSVEFVPRRIALLYNSSESPALNYAAAQRFLQMPLNHMGYILEYIDVQQPLPGQVYADRFAGAVTWFDGAVPSPLQPALQRWLARHMQSGMPLAAIGHPGFDPNAAWLKLLNLQQVPTSVGLMQISTQHAIMGYESQAFPADRNTYSWRLATPAAPDTIPLIELRDARNQLYVAGAFMPWGGFLYNPYVILNIPGTEHNRWLVDPFAFLQQALRLQQLPVPDVTTENGRRLLLAHIDGDGFPSRAEMPGNRFASDWLLTDVLQKYRIPHTVSVIEGEVAPHGLFPQYSAELEQISRRIFALDHVEIASHSYSHPYLWDRSVRHGLFASDSDAVLQMEIPNYSFDLHREIVGSVEYIRERLAPKGKPVNILLWSGDTAPSAEALEIATRNGILNMNGGDTSITRSNPSLTAVRGHGIHKNGYLQVYAPVTNENIYTNLWQGPYYGFERVIETFELTEEPRRLKAVDIYYHTYSASKTASLNALHRVYRWAMHQPLHPVFASEYIRKVQDFYTLALARKGEGWRIRGNGDLRTLRIPQSWGHIDSTISHGLAGSHTHHQERYVHMTGGQALLHTSAQATQAAVSLVEANARLQAWDATAGSTTFTLKGHVPLEFSLALSHRCKVTANGRLIAAIASHDASPLPIQRFKLPYAAASIQAQCPRA